MGTALGIGAALALTMLAENWTKVQGMHLAGDLAIFRAASAAIHLLSLKAARLRAGAAAEGAEHTLVGKDIVASSEMFRYFPMCLQALVSVIAGIATLIVYAGGGGGGPAVMLLTLVSPACRQGREARAGEDARSFGGDAADA